LNQSEIIKQAKHYFSKNRSFIKELVMSYEFKGKNYRRWKKEISGIISNPNDIRFNLSGDVIQSIKDNEAEEIDWNWIGDLSWTIEIVLNPNIDKCYDLDKKLALKCNGTARILTLYISDVIPCYTYDLHYMTYNKPLNYYEFGPIPALTQEETLVLYKVTAYLKAKGFNTYSRSFYFKKFKGLYSDTENGNASLFDVLFTDIYSYQTETLRFSDKEIIEKSGTKFRWREYYNKNGTLKERIESRWTSAGDYLKVVLDNKGQINQVKVTRKEIGRKKHQEFKLDILALQKRRKLQ
jgi:hypothetical protein